MSGFKGMKVDVRQLRTFRGQLSTLSKELMTQLRRTDAAMETVAKEWQDVQFHKFRNEFTKDRDLIQPLSDQINRLQAGPLAILENKIKKYLEL